VQLCLDERLETRALIFFIFFYTLLEWPNKEDKMGGARDAQERNDKCVQNFTWHLGDQGGRRRYVL